jgi:hypothetical protein
MGVIFKNAPQPLMPGDILLSRLTLKQPNPAHWLVAAATRSSYVHGTMVVSPTEEWSVETFGPRLRPIAADTVCWVYRVNDPNWRDIGQAAADWLLGRLPTAPGHYDWAGAGFLGVQLLAGTPNRKALKNNVPFCFEGVTDAYWQIGHDVVPEIEAGAVIGTDIANSPLLIRL